MPGIMWILLSLLAIANIGDWTGAGLAIAILGGIAVGLESAREANASKRLRGGKPPGSAPEQMRNAPASKTWGILNSLLRWVITNELWILISASPIFLFPRRSFVVVFLVIPLQWILRWRIRRRLTVRTPLDWPILLLMIMLLVSILVSADAEASLSRLAGILFGIAVFYAIINRIHSERDVGWMVSGFITLGIATAVVGILGTRWIISGKFLPSQLYSLLPRLTNFPGATQGLFDPNQVGGTLAFIVPCLGVLWAARWTGNPSQTGFRFLSALGAFFRGRWLILPLAFTSAVLLTTQSRSALFGVGISIILYFVIRWRYFRWAMLPISIVLLYLLFSQNLTSTGELLIGPTGERGPVGALDFAGRQEVWQRALYAMQDFPFTGVGLNMFGEVSKVLYPYFLISPDVTLFHAHDEYLQIAVDLGVPGLIAFIALLTAFGFMVWNVYASSPSSSSRAIALALGLGVLAHQLFGLTDAVALGAKQGIVLWIMFGIGGGLWALDQREKAISDDR